MTMYQNPEVLYEITLRCNKNCKYCGSKNVLNESDENIDKVKIAEEISSVNPGEVTITGGEPSVDNKLFNVVSIFYSHQIKCKVLTNGNLFTLSNFKDLDRKIYWYGYSINDLNDIEQCKKTCDKIPFDKVTMITNFGSHNIKYFNKLAKISTMFKCWQVQLTMGNEFQLDLNDIKNLYKNLDKVEKTDFFNVIRADNLVCGQCKAGSSGFSVCWNGDVVPCLSYRSWRKDMDVQGNLLNESAIFIWKNKFNFYRTRSFFPCCKDITGVNRLENDKLEKAKQLLLNKDKEVDKNFIPGITPVYGVAPLLPYKSPLVYGVGSSDWDRPIVYGVFDDDNEGDNK